MRYLKLYENANSQVYILQIKTYLYSEYELVWDDIQMVFKTKKDCDNWIINKFNDLQFRIINDEDMTDDAKEKYGKYILDTVDICSDFSYDIYEEYSNNSDPEWFFEVYEVEPESNVEIREDVLMRIEARKYNL